MRNILYFQPGDANLRVLFYTDNMRIKFLELYRKINVSLPHLNYNGCFRRNEFKEVTEEVAKELLKCNYFVTEDDMIFNLDKYRHVPLKIGMSRYGALGDLIQLLPIARYIKKEYPNIHLTLITELRHKYIFEREKDAYDEVLGKQEYDKKEFDKIIYLDGVLENDHIPSHDDSNYHRVKLYERFLNISLQEYDFHLSFTNEEFNYTKGLLDAIEK